MLGEEEVKLFKRIYDEDEKINFDDKPKIIKIRSFKLSSRRDMSGPVSRVISTITGWCDSKTEIDEGDKFEYLGRNYIIDLVDLKKSSYVNSGLLKMIKAVS